ncbi:MAG: TIGR02757 family protein [Bacteroidales bacterium]|nr:TIGR02757 family protein [Bacteroidales bacterium]
MLNDHDIKEFLDLKADRYNSTSFIDSDPIQVPHMFTLKEDIEIAGFLTATLAWGQRTTIIRNATRLTGMMPGGPHAFITGHQPADRERFLHFVHRTFNGLDCAWFLEALQHIYNQHGGMEQVFTAGYRAEGTVFGALKKFREKLFTAGPAGRTSRHVPDVTANSAAKRLNMFLRWMVRHDHRGVDFGLWKDIPPSALMIPLDVHSGNTARKLGLLRRKQNDWKAVEELTAKLREFDRDDPVKYDYALFGLGVFEKFG